MTQTLAQSYRYCRRVARARAKNFYYSFLLLSRTQRDAMCAVYAYMRQCDDLSDDSAGGSQEAARASLERWRVDLDRALRGDYGENPLWPALDDTVQRYGIPPQYLHEMIDGVTSDLEPRRVETFEELYDYCYQVASVVGLTVVHILGFHSRAALPLAEKCGVAFQLTNILRDVREDAERNRIYLPAEDLASFGVDPDGLANGDKTEAFARLMEFEADRAFRYYHDSLPLVQMVHNSSRASLEALIRIYYRLLERIRDSDYDVLRSRVRLAPWEKMGILAGTLLGRRDRFWQKHAATGGRAGDKSSW